MALAISILFAVIITLKNIAAYKGILTSRAFLRKNCSKPISRKKQNVVIIIPVLREQNVIEETLDHFSRLELKNIDLSIILAGTVREQMENSSNSKLLTRDVILRWIEDHKKYIVKKDGINYQYVESIDPQGDRASQITFAIEEYKKIQPRFIDIIGVYDADSLPSTTTLEEVCYLFHTGSVCCQQPVHFNRAASRISQKRGNPILVANGLYQTTWTMIRELPRWINNSNILTHYPRNIYIIGHGQFLSNAVYTKFGFPSNDVTDGIQLGYRLGMCNVKVYPLRTFCNDDVPRSIRQIVHQHKRWFGGCMRLGSAYNWAKKHCTVSRTSLVQVIDGYWSQVSWAFAAPVAVVATISSLMLEQNNLSRVVQTAIILNLAAYCYMIPVLAHKILPESISVRRRDWLALPLAIFIKCVGPNVFIIESFISLLNRNRIVRFTKVER